MSYLSMFTPVWLAALLFALQSTEANQAYQRGREAIDAGRWQEAIEAFEEAGEDRSLADAALYWQARAYSRLPDAQRALELVAELEAGYPQSSWLDDALALAAEIRGASAASDDEDLKLMALNGLMNADEEAAIPILEEFLTSERSPKLKERALFVLAQSESERAHAILARVARDGADGELQRKAIRYLGVHSSDRGLSLLSELYSSLGSVEARSAVLESFMIAGDERRLLELARNEPDPELRGKAIHLLGTMDATAPLWDLFQREPSEEVKKRMLQAMMIAGDDEHLLAVAKDPSQSDDLRSSAIQLLGAEGAGEALWQLYRQESSTVLKEKILHALFIADETGRIAEVATNASEPLELRRAAINNLGVSDDEARPVLLRLYGAETSKELKEQVLNALFIQDATSELIEIARAEKDPALKRTAVQKIALIGSPEAKEFLMEVLKQ